MSDLPLRSAESPSAAHPDTHRGTDGATDSGVYVAPARYGRGVYAARPFAKGETVLRFTGRRYTGDELDALGFTPGYPLQVDLDRYVLLDEPHVFCNHSCDPNGGLTADLELRAVREIARDEQISFDYSTTMLEDNSWTLECGCRSMNCRGVIEDFDRLPEAVQRHLIAEIGVLPFITRELAARRG
ncbi:MULTISPECIES: SET domain-containing protein [Hydrocarboniphaga]|uniref:SET domain-containing protein n=1 Tax=Hydrocarboniphaga effusa AP103 TaxID=1172194 RepID=I8I006_9GAMM|nr:MULTISPECIES: SET domain-containing protein [Hydrocarboniphaga]EIT69271.1 hypothetical protein WQQ_28530 [Hydrocarboniphaga effusa AP103]MDZ4080737.1 SET domain-containing protein [Hydrocarboniphaga sp.]